MKGRQSVDKAVTPGVYKTAGKLSLGAMLVLTLVYLALLIPDSEPPAPPAGPADPFVWNQDEYWSLLQARFVAARELDPAVLADSIQLGLAEAAALLDSCHRHRLEPASPLLSKLERTIFELAPWLAAQTNYLPEFLQVHNRLRRIVKDQSRHWDMSLPQTRDRLYRLLYGARTAAEETMLQHQATALPALLPATDEPSGAPSAEILGVTVHSGDILVSRGGAPTSALIARGNDYPGNFSHVALVHVAEDTWEVSIIEAHIERGVAVATVDEYLRDTKLRILMLRLRADHPALLIDPSLPHRAATIALKRAHREHIPYDFEMDYRDPTRLFCSEVVSAPYAQLNIRLWMGMSNISSPGVRSWLAAFGVVHFKTQEPSDLEYDPQLRVVAEWRDPETLRKDRLDNAVIDAMLESAEAGERLTYDRYWLPLARLAKAYSMFRNLLGGVGPVPEGMSATAALKNDRFSQQHTAIKQRLLILVDEFHDKRSYRPPYWELLRLARQAQAAVGA